MPMETSGLVGTIAGIAELAKSRPGSRISLGAR